MPDKPYMFKPFAEELLRGNDINAERVSRIREYGRMYTSTNVEMIESLAMLQPSRSSKEKARRLIAPMDDIISNLVVLDLEASPAELTEKPNGDRQERVAINKLARPVEELFTRTAAWRNNERLQAVALGLVGVHAMIWTPKRSLEKPAKALLDEAVGKYTDQVLKTVVQNLPQDQKW